MQTIIKRDFTLLNGYDFMNLMSKKNYQADANRGNWPYHVILVNKQKSVEIEYCEGDIAYRRIK